MPDFRKKPVVIQAVQYNGENTKEMLQFCGTDLIATPSGLKVATLEGPSYDLTPGDWIIRGVHGEHYPCKPDIFAKTYDAVP